MLHWPGSGSRQLASLTPGKRKQKGTKTVPFFCLQVCLSLVRRGKLCMENARAMQALSIKLVRMLSILICLTVGVPSKGQQKLSEQTATYPGHSGTSTSLLHVLEDVQGTVNPYGHWLLLPGTAAPLRSTSRSQLCSFPNVFVLLT